MLKQKPKTIVDDIVIDIKDISEEAAEDKIKKKAHEAFFSTLNIQYKCTIKTHKIF
jgi:hypothetical protein